MSKIEIFEGIFMILALVALWPLIFLRYEPLWYKIGLVVLVFALGGILVRRVVAMNRRLAEARKEQEAREAGAPKPVLGGNGRKK